MATTIASTRPADALRGTLLRVDGALCAALGLLLALYSGPIGAFMGLDMPIARVAVGVPLVPYAAVLFWLGGRPVVTRAMVLVPAVLNVGWVLGSVAILLSGPLLTTAGWWAVALQADAVGLLALAQLYAARRAG